MKFRKSIFVSLPLLFAGNSYAADMLFQFGLDSGGDELTRVVYTNGNTDTIKAGGMMQLAFGTIIQNGPNLETQLSVGIKFDQSTAKNGDVMWRRLPIEALEFYTTPQWRFGGGVTYHLNPTLSGSGVASGISADFDNALGAIVEVDYQFSDKFYLGGRGTFIDYTLSNSNAKVNGNSIGLNGGVRF